MQVKNTSLANATRLRLSPTFCYVVSMKHHHGRLTLVRGEWVVEGEGAQGAPCDSCGKRMNKSKNRRRTTCTACLRVCSCGKAKTPASTACTDCRNEKLGNRRFVDDREGKGYVKISVPTGEVNANGLKRCRLVYEHRYVMEQKLGRKLFQHENVHHINGVRDDNRPENLVLWSTKQPNGQRVEDKVAWAKELLALYEPEALAVTQITKPRMA